MSSIDPSIHPSSPPFHPYSPPFHPSSPPFHPSAPPAFHFTHQPPSCKQTNKQTSRRKRDRQQNYTDLIFSACVNVIRPHLQFYCVYKYLKEKTRIQMIVYDCWDNCRVNTHSLMSKITYGIQIRHSFH